jgi:glycosyltransferase involved in cell wall biosynthesis
MVSVSVAIRAYRRRWLAEAVASVLAQSWRDLELVIYDDAGNLGDVVAPFDDGRVRYVRAERKLEASGRFGAAVALCNGKYIGVLDDDDRYERAFVERLVAALDADPRAGIAFCREAMQCGTGSQPVRGRVSGRPAGGGRVENPSHMILGQRWVVAPSAMLMRRAALDAAEAFQPMPDGVAPDVFVSFRMAVTGWEHVFVDEPLVVRRSHDGRIANSIAGAQYAVATWERLRVDDPELDRIRRRELARRIIVRAVWHLSAGRRGEALADLAAARATDAGAHRVQRCMVALAARSPLGPWLALSVLRRRRR